MQKTINHYFLLLRKGPAIKRTFIAVSITFKKERVLKTTGLSFELGVWKTMAGGKNGAPENWIEVAPRKFRTTNNIHVNKNLDDIDKFFQDLNYSLATGAEHDLNTIIDEFEKFKDTKGLGKESRDLKRTGKVLIMSLKDRFGKEYHKPGSLMPSEQTRRTHFNRLMYLEKFLQSPEGNRYLYLTDIDNDFIELLKNFLSGYKTKMGRNNSSLRPVTIKGVFLSIKLYLEFAQRLGHPDLKGILKELKLAEGEVAEDDNLFTPSEEDLRAIITTDLTFNKALQETRDLFLFQCYSGLRVSDLRRLEPSMFFENYIKLHTQKTGAPCIIPLTNELKEIIEKYPGGLPLQTLATTSKYNFALKKIASITKFGEEYAQSTKIIYKPGHKPERTINRSPKSDLISSHAGRRYFVSQCQGRLIPDGLIRKVTGHSQAGDMLNEKYSKMTDQLFAKIFIRQWTVGEAILRELTDNNE